MLQQLGYHVSHDDSIAGVEVTRLSQGGMAGPAIAKEHTYPEINLEVPTTREFAVPDLERDRHLVIGMEGLVEAFAGVGLHLNVVSGGYAEQ